MAAIDPMYSIGSLERSTSELLLRLLMMQTQVPGYTSMTTSKLALFEFPLCTSNRSWISNLLVALLTSCSTVELGPNSKTSFMIKKVKQFIDEGIPIHGIGAEAHMREGYLPAGNFSGAETAFRQLCAVASECAITELDVSTSDNELWKTLPEACLDIDNCVGVSVWGVADKHSWRKDDKPLLFNDDYKPKSSFFAVSAAIDNWVALRQKKDAVKVTVM